MLKTERYFSIFPVLMRVGLIQFPKVLSQFHSEIDRRDHAVGTGDSPAGNFKRSAVIGTGARKRKAKRHVHTLVKCVKFQRNQSLVMIHGEYGIVFAVN